MKNMGKYDRIIRSVLGVLLIVLAVVLQVRTGRFWWLGILGGIFLGTSMIAFCPAYLPFKINTGKKS